MKLLNYVVYKYIFIERVTKEVKRTLTAVNVSKVFTQFLMLVLSYFIEVARTSLLNRVAVGFFQSWFFAYFACLVSHEQP